MSPLFMLSVGHIDSLHQSPASQRAPGGGGADGGRGVNVGALRVVGGWGDGGKRLKWIRRVLIETGDKGRTPGVDAHISKLSLDTHTHKDSQSSEGGVPPPQCNPRPFRHSLVKDGQVQHQETVTQSDITPVPEQCGTEKSEEASMGKVPLSAGDVLIC